MTRDEVVVLANVALAKFEVLDRLSTAWYGKPMYFYTQDDGTIYDSNERDYITLNTAIDRLAKILALSEDRIC